ncbi:MAG: flagellar hook-length control protein FliK [Synergistaceae bacterium]|jgi:flagellar hook-length control protein FliK|nr:flagellar hook-length control protein FliK [Synergistaceae bacterium]
MAVQAAAAQAQEFYQAMSPQGGGSRNGAADPTFKNVLSSMRGSHQAGAASSGAKASLAAGIVALKAIDARNPDSAPPFEEVSPSLENSECVEETRPSRFDPDIVLGTEPKAIETRDQSSADETASDDDDASGDDAEPEDVATAAPDAANLAASMISPRSDAVEEHDRANNKMSSISEHPDKRSGGARKFSEFMPSISQEDKKEADPEKNQSPDDAAREAELPPESALKSGGTENSGTKDSNDGEPGKNEREAIGASSLKKGDAKAAVKHDAPDAPSGADKTDGNRAMSIESQTSSSFASTVARAAQPQTASSAGVPMAGSSYALRSADAFGEGLKSVVEFMRNDSATEARIVVAPPALGRVDISLSSTSAGIEAAFKVDNEELKSMVQQQIDSLKASLQAQGIHVSGLTVDIRNNDSRQGRNEPYAQKKNRRGASDNDDEIDTTRIIRLDLEKGLLHWVA